MASGRPQAGIDYPSNWMEFQEWFPDDAACAEYLAKLRWSDGFECPHCHHTEGWPRASGSMQCKKCRKRTSATAGTVIAGTHKGLRTWFAAAWYTTNQKNGVSALGLQGALGLGSYQTAWAWLQKLRRAMVRPGRDKLEGDIEVDETFVGGAEPGVKGRQTTKKSLVSILVERKDEGMGRVRLAPIADASAKSLKAVIEECVADKAVIYSDDWSGYTDGSSNRPGTTIALEPARYTHVVENISGSGQKAHDLLPRVHRVGCWVLIRARCAPNIYASIWTSSPSGSIDAPPSGADCCSIA